MMTVEQKAYVRGIKSAASLAGECDGSSTLASRLEDFILCKLNVVKRKRPRRNKKRVQDPKEAWLAGFAVALAEIHRLLIGGNDSSGVCEVARNCGLTLAKAKSAGVSSYDVKELRKAGVR